MAETYDITNLVLDDNSFEILPDGDYRFTVESHEMGYSTSEKMPPNTQVITCMLKIPYMKDGELSTVTVRNRLNIYSKGLFAIREFAESIGLAPEKGRFSINLEEMDGKTGVCALNTYESNGNEYNNVQVFYAPSKAPRKTLNDGAWEKFNGDTDWEKPNDDPLFD